MPITIKRQDGDIKFFGSQSEPILTIYSDETSALITCASVEDMKTAKEISEAAMLAGLFVDAILEVDERKFKNNKIKAVYFNEANMSTEDTLYSHRKVLHWLESGKIVTVNKKERIRYRFTKFSYSDGKLVILYKPVVW